MAFRPHLSNQNGSMQRTNQIKGWANGAEGRRTELLLAARHELATRSYDQVGLRQIAARAGMDTAKLVREFGSKEQLLVDALEATFLALPTELPPSWPDDYAAELAGDAPSRLTEAFRIIAFSAPSPSVEAIVNARAPALLSLLEGAVEPGAAQAVRAAMAAAVIFGVILTRDVIGLEPPDGRRICAPVIAKLLTSLHRAPAGARPRSRAESAGPRPFGVAEAKSAILKAADAVFSSQGYEHATVRRIAADAGVDPALVVRYFGSKEALFRDVLKVHFSGPPKPDFAVTTATAALAPLKGAGSPLDITLRSAPSPTARNILKEDIENRFLRSFSGYGTDDKVTVRALMNSALYMGATFCNSILHLPIIQSHRAEALEQLTAVLRVAWAEEPSRLEPGSAHR